MLLEALAGKNNARPPIWLMRQAGRYMPQYQAIRKSHHLRDMFLRPDLIVPISKLPLELLDVDAAILFTDILTVLEGLGAKWDFNEGPVVDADLSQLQRNDPRIAYATIYEAIVQLKEEIDVPLLGFAGAPFTIATYLIEGKSSRDFAKTKGWLYSDPQTFHALLRQITDATLDYLSVQVEAGVDAVQLFDSWANLLSRRDFRTVCLPYLQEIINKVPVPVILFCRGSSFLAEDLSSIEPAALSLDWSEDLSTIRKKTSLPLQGNLDPGILFGSQEQIACQAQRILDEMRGDPGFIFNLGHGVLPGTPFENVKYLVDYVTGKIPQTCAALHELPYSS